MQRNKTKLVPKRRREFRIRRARLSDLTILVRQRRLMWEELGSWTTEALESTDHDYARWARSHLRNGSYVGWLVEDGNGRVVGGGCVWLKPIQPRPGLKVQLQPYLLSMYTEPECRGKGIATMIVEEAMDWARKKGFSTLVLHASEMGRRVYSRLGFKRSWEMMVDVKEH